jgi:hypothetical protein
VTRSGPEEITFVSSLPSLKAGQGGSGGKKSTFYQQVARSNRCRRRGGYSRLMSVDESGAVQALSDARAIFDQLITEYGGRIANTAGNSVLAEFASALEAGECCIEMQRNRRPCGRSP